MDGTLTHSLISVLIAAKLPQTFHSINISTPAGHAYMYVGARELTWL